MKSRQNRILPYHLYSIPLLVVLILGLSDTVYLFYSHYKNYTDLTFSSFCAISRSIDCDTVAQSPWSVYWGMPVALWGILGYLILIIFALPLSISPQRYMPLWKLVFYLTLIFSLVSLFLAYISATVIHSFCILCIASYGFNFTLLFQSWIICRRFKIDSSFQNFGSIFKISVENKRFYLPIQILLVLFILLQFFLPHYWEISAPSTTTNLATGITDGGHPWIGAEYPILSIEEFSDYQCFQCLKMQRAIRLLIQKHPDKIRLIHRHYPMDHEFNKIVVPTPFHVGSGKMSILAIYAISRNKFWEMNDALFELGRQKKPFNTKFLSEQTGIPTHEMAFALTDQNIRKLLSVDILSGMEKRILATPTFVINDKLYTGFIPPEIFEEALGKE